MSGADDEAAGWKWARRAESDLLVEEESVEEDVLCACKGHGEAEKRRRRRWVDGGGWLVRGAETVTG